MILIGVITMFVIIGMLVNWSAKSNTFVKSFTKKNDDGYLLRQDIVVQNCNGIESTIVSKAVSCLVMGRLGKVDGNLCYTVRSETLCSPSSSSITTELTKQNYASGTDFNIVTLSQKVIITYDAEQNLVDIS